MIRPQVGNASNEGEQRCVFQPAQAIRRVPYYYQRTKFYASREFLAGLSPFFFSTLFFHLSNRYERRSFSSLYYRPYGTILAANKTRVLSGSPVSKTARGCSKKSMIINITKFQLKFPTRY